MFLYNNSQVRKTRYFVYTYNTNNIRIVKVNSCRLPGFEEKNNENKPAFVDYNKEECQRTSLSRTKRNIRELALCNDFSHFATLTVNSEMADRYSLDICQEKLKQILKKIKRKYSNFRYLFITEKHLDGAFHFHGLIGGLPDDVFVVNEYGYLSMPIFDTSLGFNSFSPIKDYTRVCNYITKYITQACVKNSHNQIYISSRGLKKATKEEFDFIDFTPSFSNDYCSILDLRLDKCNRSTLLKIISQLEG